MIGAKLSLFTFLLICLLPLNILAYSGKDTLAVRNLLDRAFELEYAYPDSAFALSERALEQAIRLKYPAGEAGACMRLGSIWITRGESVRASPFINRALNLRERIRDYGGASNACITLSQIYIAMGKPDSAFYVLFKALAFDRRSNDSIAMSSTYLTLGNVCQHYGDRVKSLSYFLQAEAISKRINDAEGLELAYSGLGYYYFQEGIVDKALSYFLKAEKVLSTFYSPIDRARNLNNIATCYERLKKYSKARQMYFQVLTQYEKLGMKSEVALCLCNIGNLFMNQQAPDSAIAYLNRALAVASGINDLNRKAIILKQVSKAYHQKGNFRLAYDFHSRYSDLNDSLLNQDKISSISEMQTKYETEIKEKQIVLLDATNKAKSSQRNFFIAASIMLFLLSVAILFGLMRTARERKRSDKLLLNILPAKVAAELKAKGRAEAQHMDQVSVLFTDFKGFTSLSENLTPAELVDEINTCFSAFDRIMQAHGVEKIKTIGDAYMASGGLPEASSTHAEDVVKAALDVQKFMQQRQTEKTATGGLSFEIRIGVHSGPVVAGIVGVNKFAYDIWGDTVNTASRMESSGEVGKVNISGSTYSLIKDHFRCHYRGKVAAKGKGEIEMYFVEGAV